MKHPMTVWGIGPRLIAAGSAYFALSARLTSAYPALFSLGFIPGPIVRGAGGLLVAVGSAFFIATQAVFMRRHREGKLITTGTFSLCRNPIYATFILFVVPGIGLWTDSWLSVSTGLFMYAVFKASIGKEYDFLREKFGRDYSRYERDVNEMIPAPHFGRRKKAGLKGPK